MKPFKSNSKPVLKNIVVANWYGEIILEILKEKPIKSINIIAHLDIQLCIHTLSIKILRNEKKIISKGLFKTRSNFDSSKVDNYHLVIVS
jgi:hypothetical protein